MSKLFDGRDWAKACVYGTWVTRTCEMWKNNTCCVQPCTNQVLYLLQTWTVNQEPHHETVAICNDDKCFTVAAENFAQLKVGSFRIFNVKTGKFVQSVKL